MCPLYEKVLLVLFRALAKRVVLAILLMVKVSSEVCLILEKLDFAFPLKLVNAQNLLINANMLMVKDNYANLPTITFHKNPRYPQEAIETKGTIEIVPEDEEKMSIGIRDLRKDIKIIENVTMMIEAEIIKIGIVNKEGTVAIAIGIETKTGKEKENGRPITGIITSSQTMGTCRRAIVRII